MNLANRLVSPMKPIVSRLLLAIAISFSVSLAAQNPTEDPKGASGASKNSADVNRNSNAVTPAPGAGAAAPQTNTGDSSAPQSSILDRESNPGDPLLDVPPLPKGKATLVGGRIEKIDPIRDRITVAPFGGSSKMKIFFDERTHIYRDGTETTQANLHKGDRVYVDTMLDGPHVFAKNIRVITQLLPADASGQVVSYDPRTGMMRLHDQISSQPVSFTVGPQTVITKDRHVSASAADLREGSLVAVKFSPGTGRRGTAQQITILATPGTRFNFAGKVTHLDLRNGLIAVENDSDHQTYDIAFDPKSKLKDDITVGSQVQVTATFTGNGYRAETIESSN
jgi:hypothetical protein